VLVVEGMSQLLGVLQALLSSSVAGVATVMMVGPSLSGAGDEEPLGKKSHPWSFSSVPSWYGVVHRFTLLPLFLFLL
jgi:hypothetical protein